MGKFRFFFCELLLHSTTLCRALDLIARWRRYTNSIQYKIPLISEKRRIYFQGLFFENIHTRIDLG
jgi:hypothetical protein